MKKIYCTSVIPVLLTYLCIGTTYANNKNYFIENKGQWDKNILYLYQIPSLNVWITRHGVKYDLYQIANQHKKHNDYSQISPDKLQKYGQVIEFVYKNANDTSIYTEPKSKLTTYYNYFIGNNPEKWCNKVALYEEVLIKQIYPGIHQRWYFYQEKLRYDFIVEPYADYKMIEFTINGADQVYINNQDLILKTRFGEVKHCALQVYQKNNLLPSSWVINNNQYGFHIPYYDPTQPLIIDPLVWSTFIGGTASETANYGYPAGGLFIDNSGNTCVAGTTVSADYPTTVGAYDTSINSANEDIVISKLNSSGSTLLYSTFFGGNNQDVVTAIKKDASDNIYIAGWTLSPSFPTTAGVVDNTLFPTGNPDGFIAKLDATGASLLYSTYLGTTGVDHILDFAVDNLGNTYVTGVTTGGFPTTPGVFDDTYNGSYDAFVTKLNSNATMIVFSTYIGGSFMSFIGDRGQCIAVDNAYNVYVAGQTESNNFPTTALSYDNSFNGQTDIFLTKFNSSGSALIYSTFIGGSSVEYVFDIILAPDNRVYLTGYTFSNNYPVSPGCYDNTYACCNQNVIVSSISPDGTTLDYSTYIGSTSIAYGISADNNKNIYITGIASNLYVTTPCAYDETHNGGSFDAFVTKLDSALTTLLYSTYIGGSGSDYSYYIQSTAPDEVCITGWTQSLNYPTSPGCYDNSHGGASGGNTDLFVSKLSLTDICLPLYNLNAKVYLHNHAHHIEWNCDIPETAYFEVYLHETKQRLTQTKNLTYIHYPQNIHLPQYTYTIIARNKDGQQLAQTKVQIVNDTEPYWVAYPNPFSSHLNIFSTHNTQIDLLDSSGKIIFTFDIKEGSNSVNLSLPIGVYFIRNRYLNNIQKLFVTE